MSLAGQQILEHLEIVAEERRRREADPRLAQQVSAVKRHQHERFAQTYSDQANQPGTAGAVRFFLEELYGPGDFTHRDTQFARIVPALVRLFPRDIVSTVNTLARLHALSEQLDSAMGRELEVEGEVEVLDGSSYGRAWRRVARPEAREMQISLMLEVGHALDRYTRNPLLRHSLRLMRGPAQAAGLAELQQFLERGFDTFRSLRGAGAFLQLVADRERVQAARLFASDVAS
jgi:hypothetical protein